MKKTLLQIHEENISYPHIRGSLFQRTDDCAYNGTFLAVSREKDQYGNYRESVYRHDAQVVTDCITCNIGKKEEVWKEREGYLTYVRPILFQQKSFEKGDLVDVLEEAVEDDAWVPKWSENKKAVVGQKGLEIKKVNFSDYEVYTPDKRDFFLFPQHFLAPHHPVKQKYTEEENSTEDIVIKHSIVYTCPNGDKKQITFKLVNGEIMLEE